MTKPAASIPVLMYHHVSPSGGSLCTTPQNFDSQLAWLARAGYRTLGAAELAGFLAGEPAPRKSVVLSFDDGYLDNWVHAHPVLERHGMKALMFLVSGWVSDGPARPVAGSKGADLPATPTHAECKQRILQNHADDVVVRWSEVEAMRQAGTFEFHSHTHTHTRWDLQLDDREARRDALAQDLDRARAAFMRRLGQVSDHLCWPQGYFDDDYLDVARAAGFRHFHTTDSRGLNLRGADPGHIYRVAVKNRGGWLFGQRVWLARDTFWGPLYIRSKRQ